MTRTIIGGLIILYSSLTAFTIGAVYSGAPQTSLLPLLYLNAFLLFSFIAYMAMRITKSATIRRAEALQRKRIRDVWIKAPVTGKGRYSLFQ